VANDEDDYVIRVVDSVAGINAEEWNSLLAAQSDATPFMRHEYLTALESSGSAVAGTGWQTHFVLLEKGNRLAGACVLYLKNHSHGEYVFDWSWANAYAQKGLPYYPKALVAVPFTPVPGSRLLAKNSTDRARLAAGLVQWCKARQLSSLHVLFSTPCNFIGTTPTQVTVISTLSWAR
jgi:predicted N-acyltransferase